jgi:MFS family permease
MLAPFLVSPLAGVVTDRYNRKYILIASDLCRAMIVFCFLFIRDASQIWLLYVLTGLQLGLSGFYFPARNAILPDLVTPQELGAANALSSATWSTMLALGAALGGIVSGLWGIYPAFTIDALSFIASAFLVAQISYQPSHHLASTDKTVGAALKQYVDGLRYLRNHLDILVISLHKGANSFIIVSGFQVIQVTVAERIFVLGEGGGIGLGLMFGVAGIGTGLGPIIARYFTRDQDRRMRWMISVGYVISCLGMLMVAPLTSFGVFLLGSLLRGIGGGIVWVFSTQLLLQLVPGQVRGRVFATEFAIFSLASAAGAAAAGQALDLAPNISTIIFWMAGLILIPSVLWMLWLASRKGRMMNDEG